MSLLSVTDTVDVLRRCGYQLSARQVRYLGLVPSVRTGGRNAGRLYGPVDVALLAVFADLLARCRRLGLPAWSARAGLRYREAELRQAFARRAARWLLLDAITGTVVLSETRHGTDQVIELRDLLERITSAVEAHRTAYPEVWTGAAYVEPEELTEAVA
jgi:hypothetical protein